MMKKMTMQFVVIILILVAVPISALAEEDNKTYLELSGRKLGRGVQNAALGWMELPKGIKHIGEKHGIGAAATWGVLYGLGRSIQRTAVGVFEVLTFPFGLPKNFEPLIEPEYVIHDASSTSKEVS